MNHGRSFLRLAACAAALPQSVGDAGNGRPTVTRGVLVIVLGRYPIARLEFCLGQG
jgi:hypothetical protein